MKLDLENVNNTQISNAIDEWIHSDRDRYILKRRFIDAHKISQICDDLYDDLGIELSERQISNILNKNEKILFKHIGYM